MKALLNLLKLMFVPLIWRPSGKHLRWYVGIYLAGVLLISTAFVLTTDNLSNMMPLLAVALAFAVVLRYYFYAIRPKERA